ncbi:hypothetical protein K439DRAFT_981699 [Ramaria rubella]|nr:hypothetical protein K439DRAFT_981699 [Ramaria rubella]
MALPSTPTRATGSKQDPHSTPFVHKVSSVFSDRIRSHLDPLITRELQDNVHPTTHNAFLEHALGAPPEQVDKWQDFLRELGERKEVKGLMAKVPKAGDELLRYKPFCDLANFILDETQTKFPLSNSALSIRFARNDPTVIRGPDNAGTPPRKPDVVLVSPEVANWLALSKAEREDSCRDYIYWTDIFAAVEFKPGPSALMEPPSHPQSHPISSSARQKRNHPAFISGLEPPTKKSRSGSRSGSVHTGQSGMTHEHFKQLSRYPLEMLSSTNGTRRHALNLFIDGNQVQLWFYDRAGAIHSETQFNFFEDFVAFSTVIMALARLSLPQFGVLSFVKFTSDRVLPQSLEGATIALRDTNNQEHTVTLTGDVISQRPGIVGRSSFVCGAKCVTLDDELVVKFSYQDVSRTNEFELIEHAKRHNVDYIPVVYASQDFERLSEGLRGKMVPTLDTGELAYTDRVLRIMVFRRYTPMYKIGDTLSTFQAAMRDILDCIHQLFVKASILHRDISHSNVMAEKMQDGSFRGILIDFDLAIRIDTLHDDGHSSLHRTGTLPFMAVDLLTDKPVTHRFQHDLESLFYVLVWISAHFDYRGHFEHHDPLPGWQTGPLQQIRNNKIGFLITSEDMADLCLTDFYSPLKALWLVPLHNVFCMLLINKRAATLQGRATENAPDEDLYGKMLEIMSQKSANSWETVE